LEEVTDASCIGRAYYTKPVDDITDKLESLLKIYDIPDLLFDDEYLVKEFGGGTCYVYNSLPFSYAFFLRGPFSIETLYDVAYAGGDADTNASFVASMLGAICGTTIFPKLLVEGVQNKSQIIKIADLFYEKFCA
jgi:ADP-ribosylglycohydrolase